MPPVTRNQLKSEMGTPSKTPSTTKTSSGKISAFSRVMARKDPTTGLTLLSIVHIGMIVAITILASTTYLFLTGKVSLHGKTSVASVKEFSGRIEFVLRYQAINLLFLVFVTYVVIARRLATGAINPLEGNDHYVLAQTRVHSNTMEQYILTVFNQLVLATFLAPELFLRVIPLLNVLFITGRILFWLGYPKYRTCGVFINLCPVTLSTAYNVYGFLKHMNLLN